METFWDCYEKIFLDSHLKLWEEHYKLMSNQELSKEIESSLVDLAKLKRENQIENAAFSAIAGLLVSRLIDLRIDSFFPIYPEKTKWIMPAYESNE